MDVWTKFHAISSISCWGYFSLDKSGGPTNIAILRTMLLARL